MKREMREGAGDGDGQKEREQGLGQPLYRHQRAFFPHIDGGKFLELRPQPPCPVTQSIFFSSFSLLFFPLKNLN